MDVLTYATLNVVIDNQAWLYAALTVGLDAPEEEFRAEMQAWKETTGDLIEEALADIARELAEEEDESSE